MSRYTPAQLRDMASTALVSRDLGDPRWQVLILLLATRFMCHPKDIEARIEALLVGVAA